jgi:hypothetical protein
MPAQPAAIAVPRVDHYSGRAGTHAHPSAIYQAEVRGGTEHAAVHASSAAAVRLAVACPGGQRAVVGTADVTVGVQAGSGTCLVVVSSGSGQSKRGFHYTLLFDG